MGPALGRLVEAWPAEVASPELRSMLLTWLRAMYEAVYSASMEDLSVRFRNEPFCLPGGNFNVSAHLGLLIEDLVRDLDDVRCHMRVTDVAHRADEVLWRVRAVGEKGEVIELDRYGFWQNPKTSLFYLYNVTVIIFHIFCFVFCQFSHEKLCLCTKYLYVLSDHVVVTTPIGALVAGRIAFHPPLPAPFDAALRGLCPGAVVKVVATFDEPFWAPAHGFQILATPPGVVASWVDVSIVAGRPALAAFCTGPAAITIEGMTEPQLLAFVDQALLPYTTLLTARAMAAARALVPPAWHTYLDPSRLAHAPQLPGFSLAASEIGCRHTRIKCYALSDLHADAEQNLAWVQARCVRAPDDTDVFTVFIIPGDIGSSLNKLQRVFLSLTAQYDAVVYVPGNHEAWRRMGMGGPGERMASDSVDKLLRVLACARTCGVHVGPLRVVSDAGAAVTILPLHSWYHSGWDTEPEPTHPLYQQVEAEFPFHDKWSDFHLCSWPADISAAPPSITMDDTSLAEAFAALNEPFLTPLAYGTSTTQVPLPPSAAPVVSLPPPVPHGSPLLQRDDTVITFSHFVPRQELCIEKRFLIEPLLARVIGSDPLEAQIRRIGPHVHLFGHTHLPMDLTLDGIRYVQWPLGYAHEAALQCAPVHANGPLLVSDSQRGVGAAAVACVASWETRWSRYYRATPRNPAETATLAPWVVQRMQTYADLGKGRTRRSEEKK